MITAILPKLQDMERSWSLYNKVEKLRVDDLKPDQVRTILLAIPASQIQNWYACQEGDLHWVPLNSVSEFYRDLHGSQDQTVTHFNAPRAVGEDFSSTSEVAINTVPVQKTNHRRPLFEDAPEAVRTDPSLEVTAIHTSERRLARRYPRAIGFKVVQGTHVFQTKTVDISMGGMSIEATVPGWLPRTFQAELSLNGARVMVVCKRVSQSQLRLMDAESWDVIRQWIMMG